MSIFRAPVSCASTTSLLASIALLSACGGEPAPVGNNSAALDETIENVSIATENSAALNETAPATSEQAAEPATTAPDAGKQVAAATPAAAPAAPAAAAAAAAAAADGDAANGAKLFAQCKICHSVETGKNGLGPSLHGVVGRAAGTLAGFNFSPAMKNSGITWDDAKLSEYLRSPMRYMPGTKMAFAGIADEARRADVIAYLETLK